jgi:hypothetical protein
MDLLFLLPNGKNLPPKKKNTNGKLFFFFFFLGATQLSIIQEFYELLVYVGSMW